MGWKLLCQEKGRVPIGIQKGTDSLGIQTVCLWMGLEQRMNCGHQWHRCRIGSRQRPTNNEGWRK
jgi:hypothetical protein